MTKEEIKIFIALNIVSISAYWGIPFFWELSNDANTSFIATLYFLPLAAMVVAVIFNLVFCYVAVSNFAGKYKGVK